MRSKTQALKLALTTGAVLTALSAPAQAYTVYTSFPAWQAALSRFRNAPLPVLGASAAFVWSRRLRRRLAAHSRPSAAKTH
jgi:hypothetical protein